MSQRKKNKVDSKKTDVKEEDTGKKKQIKRRLDLDTQPQESGGARTVNAVERKKVILSNAKKEGERCAFSVDELTFEAVSGKLGCREEDINFFVFGDESGSKRMYLLDFETLPDFMEIASNVWVGKDGQTEIPIIQYEIVDISSSSASSSSAPSSQVQCRKCNKTLASLYNRTRHEQTCGQVKSRRKFGYYAHTQQPGNGCSVAASATDNKKMEVEATTTDKPADNGCTVSPSTNDQKIQDVNATAESKKGLVDSDVGQIGSELQGSAASPLSGGFASPTLSFSSSSSSSSSSSCTGGTSASASTPSPRAVKTLSKFSSINEKNVGMLNMNNEADELETAN